MLGIEKSQAAKQAEQAAKQAEQAEADKTVKDKKISSRPDKSTATSTKNARFILDHAPDGESNTSINFETKSVKIKIVDKVIEVIPEYYENDGAKRNAFYQQLIKMGFKPLST